MLPVVLGSLQKLSTNKTKFQKLSIYIVSENISEYKTKVTYSSIYIYTKVYITVIICIYIYMLYISLPHSHDLLHTGSLAQNNIESIRYWSLQHFAI